MGHKLQGLQASTQVRTGIGVWTGEIVASFALLATIPGCLRAHPNAVPYAVGLVITAGHWCRSSTSFSNPAVTPQLPSRGESEFRISSAAWPNVRAGTTNARDRMQVRSAHGLVFAG